MILFGSSYWQGMLDWLRGTMLREGKIGEGDLRLMVLTDSITEVRDIILASMKEEEQRTEQEEGARAETRHALAPDKVSDQPRTRRKR